MLRATSKSSGVKAGSGTVLLRACDAGRDSEDDRGKEGEEAIDMMKQQGVIDRRHRSDCSTSFSSPSSSKQTPSLAPTLCTSLSIQYLTASFPPLTRSTTSSLRSLLHFLLHTRTTYALLPFLGGGSFSLALSSLSFSKLISISFSTPTQSQWRTSLRNSSMSGLARRANLSFSCGWSRGGTASSSSRRRNLLGQTASSPCLQMTYLWLEWRCRMSSLTLLVLTTTRLSRGYSACSNRMTCGVAASCILSSTPFRYSSVLLIDMVGWPFPRRAAMYQQSSLSKFAFDKTCTRGLMNISHCSGAEKRAPSPWSQSLCDTTCLPMRSFRKRKISSFLKLGAWGGESFSTSLQKLFTFSLTAGLLPAAWVRKRWNSYSSALPAITPESMRRLTSLLQESTHSPLPGHCFTRMDLFLWSSVLMRDWMDSFTSSRLWVSLKL